MNICFELVRRKSGKRISAVSQGAEITKYAEILLSTASKICDDVVRKQFLNRDETPHTTNREAKVKDQIHRFLEMEI